MHRKWNRFCLATTSKREKERKVVVDKQLVLFRCRVISFRTWARRLVHPVSFAKRRTNNTSFTSHTSCSGKQLNAISFQFSFVCRHFNGECHSMLAHDAHRYCSSRQFLFFVFCEISNRVVIIIGCIISSDSLNSICSHFHTSLQRYFQLLLYQEWCKLKLWKEIVSTESVLLYRKRWRRITKSLWRR